MADLGIKAHAHMLRHARGYKLANDGHDTRAIQAYLGHRNIQNTTRHTTLAPQRFRGFFATEISPPKAAPKVNDAGNQMRRYVSRARARVKSSVARFARLSARGPTILWLSVAPEDPVVAVLNFRMSPHSYKRVA
jgi:hypothetical protein